VSEPEHLRATLALAGRPDVVDTLLHLRRCGPATITELKATGVHHPIRVLNDLAIAGCVRRCTPGSWDDPPTENDRFEPTGRGDDLTEILFKIHGWGVRYFADEAHRTDRRAP
jgi:hypothetical protein